MSRSTARSRGEPFLSASLFLSPFLSPLHSATDTYSSLLSLSLRNSPAHRSRASLGALSFSDGIHSRLVEAPVSTSVDFVLIFYDPHDATSPCSPHSCSSLLTIGERLETDSKKKKREREDWTRAWEDRPLQLHLHPPFAMSMFRSVVSKSSLPRLGSKLSSPISIVGRRSSGHQANTPFNVSRPPSPLLPPPP